MPSNPLFRLQAFAVAVLLCALTTGAPSHHHGDREAGPVLESAGHHGHGTQLVEQSERLTSQLVVAVAVRIRAVDAVLGDTPLLVVPAPAMEPFPRGLPPPPVRPRAPPVSA